MKIISFLLTTCLVGVMTLSSSKLFSQSTGAVTEPEAPQNKNFASTSQIATTFVNDPLKTKGTAFFGAISFGYSNLGMIGRSDFFFRSGNEFLVAGYSKSHICFLDDYRGEYFTDKKSSESHVTVQTYSVRAGALYHEHLQLSGGIAYSRFLYEHTQPMHDIISLKSIWATAIDKNWGDTVLSSHLVHAFGIPLEACVLIMPSHPIGFSAGVSVYLNTNQIIYSAEIGIRFGRVIRKKCCN